MKPLKTSKRSFTSIQAMQMLILTEDVATTVLERLTLPSVTIVLHLNLISSLVKTKITFKMRTRFSKLSQLDTLLDPPTNNKLQRTNLKL